MKAGAGINWGLADQNFVSPSSIDVGRPALDSLQIFNSKPSVRAHMTPGRQAIK
jgi:hypothetical protein